MQPAPLQTAQTYMPASSLSLLRLYTTVIRHSTETISFRILNATEVALKCQGFAISPAKIRYIDRWITQGRPSQMGRQWNVRIWTIPATCKKKGRSSWQFLQSVLGCR